MVQPGHIFPLRAKDGGVLERAGQTEASVDLARLAGLTPAGVICEIMNDDGTMARVPDLVPYAEHHGLKMVHGRRPDRLPAADREAGRAGRRDGAADLLRRVHRGRLPLPRRRQTPRGDGQGRRRRRRGRARPRPQRVPDRRRLPQHALRLRRAARGGALEDRAGGPGRPPLPLPGGPGDRAAQQAARLQAPGAGRRHGRGEPQARLAGRPARLRHRRPDPRRPRA